MFFINGKPAVINGLRTLRNPPSWLVTFLLVPLNKIYLFSKDVITFIIYFISSFFRVIPEPVIDNIPFLTRWLRTTSILVVMGRIYRYQFQDNYLKN